MILRTPLILLALAACDFAAPAAAPAPTAEPIPAPRRVVRSCPAAGGPVVVDFDPRVALGDGRGVTWLYGQAAGGPALAHLGADDRLALTPVPLRAEAGAAAGDRVWLYTAEAPTRWLSVDVSDPERPVPGAVAALTTGARQDAAAVFAVGPRRAVVVVGPRFEFELVLLDTATHAAVAPPHPLGVSFGPLAAACGDDGCFVLAVDSPGDDIASHLVVLRVLPDGAREQEEVARDWSGQLHVARRGEQVLALWSTLEGIRLRALDREGRLLGPVVSVPWDSKRKIRETGLFHADGAVVLAVGEQSRWSVAVVGPHGNLGPLRELAGADRRFLAGAPLDDGLAWINVGEAARPDEPGAGVLTRALEIEAVGGFLPTTGEPGRPTSVVLDDSGVPGGHALHVLTRPGAAAALVVPRGELAAATRPVLTPLRASCPPAPVVATEPRVDPQPAAVGAEDAKCRAEPP